MKRYLNRIIFFVFILSFSLTSCGGESVKEATGTVIELNYAPTIGEITGGQWIEIDGYRFTHYETHEEYHQGEYSLPATRFYIIEEAQNTGEEIKLMEPFSPINIAIRINEYLHILNDSNPENRDEGFELLNISPQLLLVSGKLRIARKDTTEFTVRSPADYPVEFYALE
jgi:hypothetical protein